MKRIAFLPLLLAFAPGPTLAQDAGTDALSPTQRKMCEETPCQRDLRVILRGKEGGTFDRTFKVFPPTAMGSGFIVVAGQTVHVEAEVVGDKLANYKAVTAVVHPERTITAEFKQQADGGMLLTVDNPFPKALKFRMGIMPLDKESLYATSSCPIEAGLKNFESWPYPIFQVVLTAGHFPEGDATGCVE
ncbi:MAG: hypothetical protein EON93_05745 [Burkholderiales bacterium]|nr:MAG: hypothetical protein EON93_05745 [Burkholderiales bacterium]